MVVIGDKERESGQVSVRSHEEGDLGAMDARDLVERITA
jgi:threonyl-tRNA synthetase